MAVAEAFMVVDHQRHVCQLVDAVELAPVQHAVERKTRKLDRHEMAVPIQKEVNQNDFSCKFLSFFFFRFLKCKIKIFL